MKDNMKYVLREIFEECLEESLFGNVSEYDERVIHIELRRQGNTTFCFVKDGVFKIDCALEVLKENWD